MSNTLKSGELVWGNRSTDIFSEDIKLGEILGRGAFGDVYRASWDNQIVAVKKIHIDRDAQNTFEMKIKQISLIQHPNIIMLLGIASDAEYHFIIMEYAECGSLHNFLHGHLKQDYSTEQALSWARQCAEGVAYLHGVKPKPLLHRDLKPENLLLKNQARVLKICDFGTLAEQKKTMTNRKGSAAYMAPEVFAGNTYNEKCDVYSWSIVLWEILTRQIPFKELEKSETILWRILQSERPLYIGDWPASLKQLIQSCWNQEADKRPTMENVVGEMLKLEKDSLQIVENDLKELQPTETNICSFEIEAAENSQDHPSASAALSPPEVAAVVPSIILEDIQFEKALGRGSYGTVYRAKWNNQKVAVKKMFTGEEEKFFDIEVQQLSQVRHDLIIKLLGIAADSEFKYIILEFAEGGSLESFLHNEIQALYFKNDVLYWAIQCAIGLDYLHTMEPNPILHRDLKPANLLLSHNKQTLKICDFGTVAELKKSMTQDVGTAAYMAPEVFAGTKYNEKCDVYSYGIVLWEMFMRQEPYSDYDFSAAILWNTHRGLRPPYIQDCPVIIKNLMENCWDKDPNKRPSMGDILDEIEQMENGEPYLAIGDDLKSLYPELNTGKWEEIKNKELISNSSGTGYVYKADWKEHKVVIKNHVLWSNWATYIPLKHLNIVNVVGVLLEPNALLLEYADGGNLEDMLHGELQLEFKRGHAFSWAHQCAKGAAYLQCKNFLKMYLSPRKLLLSNKGRHLKINCNSLFFKPFEENPAYTAPEILTGNTNNEKCAVYSWSILLWEILAREVPFKDYNEKQVKEKVVAGEKLRSYVDWPLAVRDLLLSCWDADWVKRPTMPEVVTAMEKIVAEFPEGNEPIDYEYKHILKYDFLKMYKEQCTTSQIHTNDF